MINGIKGPGGPGNGGNISPADGAGGPDDDGKKLDKKATPDTSNPDDVILSPEASKHSQRGEELAKELINANLTEERRHEITVELLANPVLYAITMGYVLPLSVVEYIKAEKRKKEQKS